MTITHELKIDLVRPAILPPVAVVQGDTYTREVQISLYAAGVAWELPEGHDVAIRYSKPDGTAGKYDTMPDGSMAWRSEGNTVNIMLCPQMLTVPGVVPAQVSITLAERTVSTFTFNVSVEPDASKGALASENYINWRTAFLPQLTGAKVGQYPVIAEVDEKGRVVAFEAVDAPSGGNGSDSGGNANQGLTAEQIAALDSMFKVCAFIKDDVSAEYNAFKTAFGIGGEVEPDEPDVPVVPDEPDSGETVDTSPIIARYGVGLNNSGGIVEPDAGTEMETCITDFYDIPEGYTGRVSGLLPNDGANYATCDVQYQIYQDNTFKTHWSGSSLMSALGSADKSSGLYYASSWPANKVRFTLITAYVEDSYLYFADTGDIIFAGKNTKYYGMANIDGTMV